MKIENCKVNGLKNPIGYKLDTISITFDVSDTKSVNAAYSKIMVCLDENCHELLFEMDVDVGEETILDLELMPKTRYYYRIFVQGNNGDSAYSDIHYFETGIDEWSAKWIMSSDSFHPIFFKSFSTWKKVKQARLYICGLGLYEAYINGNKVGNEYLTPGLHDYTSELQYQTYDIKEYLSLENDIRVLLGNGWYKGRFGLDGKDCLYGDSYKLIAQIEIIYEDGKKDLICSDDSWKYYGSDIEQSSIYDGEIYNHLLWENKDNSYKPVKLIDVETPLIERYNLPIVVKDELRVKEIIHTLKDEIVLDFGQNMAGFVQMSVDIKKGEKVILDYGEILQDGCFYNENYRSAKSQFIYVSNGIKEIVWPHFTYYGFRYVRVSGLKEIKSDDFVAKVIYSDLDRTGYFFCSDSKINRLYENALWGQCSNFIDIPTDCPQRDERLGWTGDTQVFSPTASYNMDTRAFYRKFLHDLSNEQKKHDGGIPNYFPSNGLLEGCCSVWGDCANIVSHQLKKFYRNKCDYRNEYEMMKKWISYNEKHCLSKSYLIKPQMQFGDWLALDGVTTQSMRGGTDEEYIASMYLYQSCVYTYEMGYELKEDASYYLELANKIKEAILDEYFSVNGRCCVDTQTGYLLSLHFKVYKNKEIIIQQLLNRFKRDGYQIRCGFVGAPMLCQILAKNGLIDLAFMFLFNEDFPGWLHCVNLGATTIWERWNSVVQDGKISGTGMNSLNHYAYGNIVEFLYAYVAGIKHGKNGFKEAIIEPMISNRFDFVNCSYHSVNGKYTCNWMIQEDGKIIVDIEIPFGCKAMVILPQLESKEYIAGKYHIEYYPEKDIRYVFNEKSFLRDIVKNEEAIRIVSSNLPQILWLGNSDVEGQTTRLCDLINMGYLGITKEMVDNTLPMLYLIRK